MTSELLVPLSVASNLWFCDESKDTEEGVNEIVTGGFKVIRPVADLAGSATLVAVMVTDWELAIEDGAVYRPAAEIVPTGGLSDQVTAVLPVPKTVAVNGCVAEGLKLRVDGLRDTATVWRSVITPVAVFDGSATLLAVTVTLWVVGIVLGAT